MQLIIALVCIYIFFRLQAIIYKTSWKKGFSAGISFESHTCREGDRNSLTETVTNNKLLPLPMVNVKFSTPRSFVFENEDNSSITDYYYRNDVFTLLNRQTIKRTLNFRCMRRGCFNINDISIITSDLLMRQSLSTKFVCNTVIHVYPRRVDITPFEIPFKTILGNYVTQKHTIDDPFEFRGIREYQPYDTMRSINWKISARQNKLQVNTFFTTASQEVVIFLNLDSEVFTKSERLQEAGIQIAGTLADKFVAQRIPVALETNGHDIFTKEQICRKSGSGPNHIEAIDHSLSRIDLNQPYDDFTTMIKDYFESKISTGGISTNSFYIFISNYRHDNLMDYYGTLKSLGLACYFIVPEFKITPVDVSQPDVYTWEVDA
ncbi:MAG: DUF58 domain-containing protein [Lachnospiraceae bacterium]|nr:DUF58 domain-containing protein [Lachnospiraceae bacterium]